jgi:hypothetical protein
VYRLAPAKGLTNDAAGPDFKEGVAMPLWRLIPVDLDDPNWEASSHRGFAVVRAPSEAVAREAVEAAFGVRTRFSPRKGLRVPPWLRSELVRAEIIEESVYPVEGPTEILEPFFESED